MKMKTSELYGPALDWAVAQCEGLIFQAGAWYKPATEQLAAWRIADFAPSRHWSQGGPIMERENICIRGIEGGFHAWYHQCPPKVFGRTMLIAAMRCFVASKLGDEVEVPEELL